MLGRLLVVACLAGTLIGCSGDGARGVNRDRDRPRSGDKPEGKQVDKPADKADKPADKAKP